MIVYPIYICIQYMQHLGTESQQLTSIQKYQICNICTYVTNIHIDFQDFSRSISGFLPCTMAFTETFPGTSTALDQVRSRWMRPGRLSVSTSRSPASQSARPCDCTCVYVMYICLYICLYIYMFIYICIYMYILSTYTHIYIYVYTCTSSVHTHTYIYIQRESTYIVFICIYICIYSACIGACV